MREIPIWLFYTMLVFGVVEIVVSHNKWLSDIWYAITLTSFTRVSKELHRQWTLLSGFGLVLLGLFGLLLSR